MKYTILGFGMFLLLAGCSSHQAASDQSTHGAHLNVKADPRQGFAPLRVTFHVLLEGVADNDENFYCMKEEWEFGDGAISTEKPNCDPFTPESKVTKEFFVEHQFYKTGNYSARFKLGDHLKSIPINISVL